MTVPTVEAAKLTPAPAIDWAATINTEYAALEKANKDAIKASYPVVERAIKFGTILKRAKDAVGHGEWGKWLKTNCPNISERTAQRYMKLAEKASMLQDKMKSDTVSDLSLRKALALTNGKEGGGNNSDRYDTIQKKLIEKLSKMDAGTAEASAQKTIEEITKIVSTKLAQRWKPKLAA